MGVATGNDDDGCAVVVSKILICRMRRAASYPAYTRSLVGPVSVGATGHYRVTYDARWCPADHLPARCPSR
ncbi:hypothetical protein B6S66_16785 [Citrobacter werkmanii]|nr:hypothetical protein BO998_01625 [Citrobacter werkmanii]OSP17398.1 hypothetical protein B6S66_16785 [Citrobacter werkmanii]